MTDTVIGVALGAWSRRPSSPLRDDSHRRRPHQRAGLGCNAIGVIMSANIIPITAHILRLTTCNGQLLPHV
ncbi:MAG: hypothetical protein ACLVL7_04535 [Anaerotruncus massiliensis (ex Togo et al. 2019)]